MTNKIDVRIEKIKQLSSDVRMFDLAPLGSGIKFEPGGHIDIDIPLGLKTQQRSYSHIGIGSNQTLQIAVKLSPNSRGGSDYMWRLTVGDTIKAKAAKNNFILSYDDDDYELLAGGIGITPIIGMARSLRNLGKRVKLRYCVRSSDDAPFVDEISEEFGSDFVLHDDKTCGTLDIPSMINGFHKEAAFYMCGPVPMMDVAKGAWLSAGRKSNKLNFETFGSSNEVAAYEFKVTVVETGVTINVPADMTLLDALLSEKQQVLFDCQRGECGLCVVEIDCLNGKIDHRDVFFSDAQHAANDAMCACVSRLSSGSARISIDSILHGRTEKDSSKAI